MDDIWWITFALEIDALILTNDKLRDWKPGGKYARPDLDWVDIENRRVEFSFEPKNAKWNKFGDKCEEQVFTAAELETLAEMNPLQKSDSRQKQSIHLKMNSILRLKLYMVSTSRHQK